MEERFMRKGKKVLLRMTNNMLSFFENTDKEEINVDDFSYYVKIWTGNSITYCMPLLKKFEAVTVMKSNRRFIVQKVSTAVLYKSKILKMKKYIEEYPDEFVPINKELVLGKRRRTILNKL